MAIKNKSNRPIILAEKTGRVEKIADPKVKVEIVSPKRA